MENFFIKKVEKIAQTETEKIAFIQLDKKQEVNKLTYGEIVIKAKELSQKIKKYSINNAVAAIFLPSCIDISIISLACMYANITPIFKTISDTLEKSRFDYQFEELVKAVKKIDLVITDIDRLGLKQKCLDNNINFYSLKREEDSIMKYKINNERKIADLIIMTSGSTKSCKAVKLSFKNLKSCLENCKEEWDLNETSISLSWAPHSHVLGLITGFLLPMYSGGKSIIMSPNDFSEDPLSWIEIITKYDVTNCSTTLFGIEICNKLYDEIRLKKTNLKNINYIAIGGERITSDTLQKFYEIYSKYNLKDRCFSPSYGMTENSGVVCSITNKDEYWKVKINRDDLEFGVITEDDTEDGIEITSVGKPPKETYIYIVNEEDKILKEDRIGEIIISSPGLSEGYIAMEDDHSYFDFKCLEDRKIRRFFRTGDLGAFHKGELIITGRSKDVINIKGKKYSPFDIENIITNGLPYRMKSNAAFSVGDKGEEKVIIFQEITEKQKESKELIYRAIKEEIKKRMNLNVYDIIFLKTNKIPRTESKKIQRQKCKVIYEEYFYNEKEEA